MAVYVALQLALPVCLVQQDFLSRLVLDHGNTTTFTSGVNIHMSIHFTMVTRQHDIMVKPTGLVG